MTAALSYAWTFSGGAPSSAQGALVQWTAPAADSSDVTATAVASDGHGGQWNRDAGDGRLIGAAGDTCCWGPSPGYDDVTCP